MIDVMFLDSKYFVVEIDPHSGRVTKYLYALDTEDEAEDIARIIRDNNATANLLNNLQLQLSDANLEIARLKDMYYQATGSFI